MKRLIQSLVLACCALAGCAKEPAAKSPGVSPTVVKVTNVNGFDEDAEPEIRLMSDGSLHVVLSFMPPSFVLDEDTQTIESFDDFDKQLERAIGVPVIWEDREVFIIQTPQEDTSAKIKQFLEGYRSKLKMP